MRRSGRQSRQSTSSQDRCIGSSRRQTVTTHAVIARTSEQIITTAAAAAVAVEAGKLSSRAAMTRRCSSRSASTPQAPPTCKRCSDPLYFILLSAHNSVTRSTSTIRDSTSVCPPVRPSNAWIVTKRDNRLSKYQHCTIEQCF